MATIVNPLPNTLTNGTTADANQVMVNFNQIVNNVNSNAVALTAANSIVGNQSITGTLTVSGTITGNLTGNVTGNVTGTTGVFSTIGAPASTSLAIQSNGVSNLFLSIAGNIGVGSSLSSPSPWNPGQAIEMGFLGNALWGYQQGNIYLLSNVYYNSGFLYASTGPACYYNASGGVHTWGSAPSGTIGTTASLNPYLSLDQYGRLYGHALHNNAQSPTGTTNQYIASGTYSPTITNGTNTTGTYTNYSSNWTRVGNVVTVSCAIGFNVTSNATNTVLNVSIPLANSGNFSGTTQANGSGSAAFIGSVAGTVNSNNGAQTVGFQFVSAATGATVGYFSFTYVTF